MSVFQPRPPKLNTYNTANDLVGIKWTNTSLFIIQNKVRRVNKESSKAGTKKRSPNSLTIARAILGWWVILLPEAANELPKINHHQ